jgi:hypothetical protein
LRRPAARELISEVAQRATPNSFGFVSIGLA